LAEATKQDVLRIIEKMPEDASIVDIMYELYVHANIDAGLEDIRAGRLIAHDDVMQEFARWLESTGPQEL
jgi:predicted transcriptional regulator